MGKSSQNRYGSLASRVYHLDKPIGHSFGDVEFYASLLHEVGGPVFEPAVGAGRVLIPLRERGIDVSGSDPSPEMLDLCIEECTRRGISAQVELGTFATIPQGRDFAAIIVPAGSIQLVSSPGEVLDILSLAHSALADGGRLIFDLDPLGSLAESDVSSRIWTDGDDALTMTAIPESVDFASQSSVTQLRYELWREGELRGSELDRFALRFWGVYEIELALRAAGFDGVEISADYSEGKPVSASTEIMTVIATKRGG